MCGDTQVRFLGGKGAVRLPTYPTTKDCRLLLLCCFLQIVYVDKVQLLLFMSDPSSKSLNISEEGISEMHY